MKSQSSHPKAQNPPNICHENGEKLPPFKGRLLVTRQQLAERLQVSLSTIDRWRRENLIPFFHIPTGNDTGVIRFHLGEVMEALQQFRVGHRKEVRDELNGRS
jgi:hypothetical protein